MLTRLFAAPLLVAALNVAVGAQDVTGTIEGTVRTSNGPPPAGLQVRAVGANVTVTTDPAADGSFRFTDLPLANYRVQVVDSTGRVVATGTARVTAAFPVQTIALRMRAISTELGGRFAEPATFYTGPVGLTPSIALMNAGVDTNVFNEASATKSDTAFMLEPETVVTLDADPVRGEGSVRGGYLYFNKYSDERSLDVNADGRLEVAAGRFTPWVNGLVDGGRRRINHEIDLRARQLASGVQAGVDARVTERTVASLAFGRNDYGFDPDEIFLGANLQQLLNRRVLATTIEGRQTLISGLSALAQVNVATERFRFAPQRDADIVRVQTGIIHSAGNRTSGSVRLGYIGLNAVGTSIAEYRGFAASLDEDVRLGSRMRLLITGIRDIDFSFDTRFPDYVRTGAVADLRAQLTDVWDVDLRVAGERMTHLSAPGVTASRYADNYGFFGAGLGVRIVRGLRLGVEGGREERDSPVAGRGFIGYRAGAAVIVGTRPLRVCGCGFE
ncbi:MAG TPA: TonB-dependent receptor [Vicinamibacterales bacterium]|jgi:hypothetical protein